MKIRIAAMTASLLVMAISPAAGAEDIEARSLAATCTGCHGTDGNSAGAIPTIAGLPREQIVRLMLEFRDDTRPATVMHRHARGYTQEQIERIAAFFAAQKRR